MPPFFPLQVWRQGQPTPQPDSPKQLLLATRPPTPTYFGEKSDNYIVTHVFAAFCANGCPTCTPWAGATYRLWVVCSKCLFPIWKVAAVVQQLQRVHLVSPGGLGGSIFRLLHHVTAPAAAAAAAAAAAEAVYVMLHYFSFERRTANFGTHDPPPPHTHTQRFAAGQCCTP
jgi:hypothetical protein